MKRIAVFGANGNLGRQAVLVFKNAGWNVRAVTRDGKYEHAQGVETVAADALNEQQVIDAATGCDFIFNALNPIYTKWEDQCMVMARNIMTAAEKHNCVHLFPGNVYNFGTVIPAVINADTPDTPDHRKARIRVEMEELFRRNSKEHQVQTIIVRVGDFFGGTRTGASWFDLEISKKLTKGKLIYPGPLDQEHSWVYLPDLAQVFVKLAEKADEINAFDVFPMEGHCVTGTQFKTAMETITGGPLKVEGIPWPMLRVIGIFVPMLKEVHEMKYLWRVAHRLDGRKLEGVIGAVPKTLLEEALVQALRDLGKGDLVVLM